MTIGSDISDTGVTGVDPVSQAGVLERIADLIPGLLYVYNHETQMNEYANRSTAQFVGYTAEEVAQMGTDVLKRLLHPEDFAKVPQHFALLQRLEIGAYASFEYRVRAKSGQEIWFRSIDTVINRSADGRVLRHLGIANDISAQKLAEAELFSISEQFEARVDRRTAALRDLNDALEERVQERTIALKRANEDLKRLTYIATHDLRVPVNNLASLTHMMEEARPMLSDEHAETLSWMQEVCTQASEKLDAMICAAQAHIGTNTPAGPVKVAPVLEEVLVNLHPQCRASHARIKTDLKAGEVTFLKQNLRIILQALIGNALKFRDPKRRLEVCVATVHEGDDVGISVADNGVGIDLARDGGRLFSLCETNECTTHRAGVSLPMVRQILERCGGRIAVDSAPGKGATFHVTIPGTVPRAATCEAG